MRWTKRKEELLVLMTAALFEAQALPPYKRHMSPPMIKTANMQLLVSSESALMLSPCRPENDGYYGGTYGNPEVLHYKFEMDATTNGDVENALNAIEDRVVDAVIANAFPEICSFGRRLQEQTIQSRATGFRFSEGATIDTRSRCKEESKVDSVCRVYEDSIWIFGKELNNGAVARVSGIVSEALSSSLSAVSQYGILRIEASETWSHGRSSGRPGDIEGKNVVSPGAKAGMAISLLALVTGLALLALYIRKDRQRERDGRSSWQYQSAHFEPTFPTLSKGKSMLGSKARISSSCSDTISAASSEDDIYTDGFLKERIPSSQSTRMLDSSGLTECTQRRQSDFVLD